MSVCLMVQDEEGRLTGQVFSFDQHDTFLFGRDPKAHCHIADDPAVSRMHFLLEIIPPNARLRDLGSTNGVKVNGIQYGGKKGPSAVDGTLSTIEIKNGDRIGVGRTTLEFRVVADTAAPRSGADRYYSATVELDDRESSPAFGPFSLDDAAGTDAPANESVCSNCHASLKEQSMVRVGGEVFCMNCRMHLDDRYGDRDDLDDSAVDRLLGAGGPITIPGYQITGLIGQGKTSDVYHAKRVNGQVDTAVKVLRTEEPIQERSLLLFRRNITPYREFRNDNIVAIIEDGYINNNLYLVMEYMGGGCLAKRLAGEGPVRLEDAMPIMRQILRGLAAAHKAKLLHRNIKPSNILFTQDRSVAKLGDLGLTKTFLVAGLTGFTTTNATLETATCLPPEQLAAFRRMTPMADVFSLGATFYEMLTGRQPYNFKSGKDPIATVLGFDLTPLANLNTPLPQPLVALIDRALLAVPEARFIDAGAMLAEFEKL